MFSWGEDCQRGFWLKDAGAAATLGPVHRLDVTYRIQDLSAGRNVLAFVKTNGNAFIIRTNEKRERGKQKFVKCKEKIVAVSCGDDSVTLLSERGGLLCVDTTRPPFIPSPLEGLSDIQVSQVACGSRHSVALSKDGQVFTWGQDSRGQLGLGRTRTAGVGPQHLRALSAVPVVQVAAGGEHSFALSVSGGAFGWGRNDRGQLGLGDAADRHTPTSAGSLNAKGTSGIRCGQDHTAVLTKDGVVFTFGSGRHGQLGHNSTRNELRPRLVAELWGSKVIEVACGRRHTLVLSEARRVYSFGCGDEGQLGREDGTHPSVPLPVQLPRDGSYPRIGRIYAGGNCSFATCFSDEEDLGESNPDNVCSASQLCLDNVLNKWTSEYDSKSWPKTKQKISKMFSSASCLNRSFLEQSKHFQTSPEFHGLDLTAARRAFRKLVKKEKIQREIEAAVLHMLPSLDKTPVGVEGLRIYLLLIELLHAMQKHTKQQSTKLAEVVATAIVNLSVASLQVIGNWWSSLSPSTMVRYVQVWKRALSVILSYQRVPRSPAVRNLLAVLQYMYNANGRVAESQRLANSEFYLQMDFWFLLEEVELWTLRSKHQFGIPKPLILCNYPVVMDLQTKKMLFDANTTYNKVQSVEYMMNILLEDFWGILPSPEDTSFVLDLSRESVLEDTFEQLSAAKYRDFKKPLAVLFDDQCEIDAIYLKDFFYKVFHELVSPESGMFMFNDSETLAWFSSAKAQEDERFFLFGVLCGLALYNQHIVYLPFPLVLFKKLLGLTPTLEDLMEFSPCLGDGLRLIMYEYSEDVISNLCMDFSISWDGTEVHLDPEHPFKPVTSQNKKEFVDAYVNHAFNSSVDGAFREFRRGFFQVCERDFVKLFRPKELQDMLVGKHFHDWEKLKQNTEYQACRRDDPYVQMFWEVFDELTEEQKKAFLWFVTGFEHVPVLDKIKMKIDVHDKGDHLNDQYYPQTHTCYSLLELPLYSTKEIMKAKLTEALNNGGRIYR